MTESAVKDAAVKALRKGGRWARRMPSGHLTGAGMPDVLVALKLQPGQRVAGSMWLEFKQPGKRPTRLQWAKMHELAAAGFAVAVVYSVEAALNAVRHAEDARLLNVRWPAIYM